MKKISVAILALVYLAVSSGIAMSIHYCMGKVTSVDLVHKTDRCSKCGMKLSGGCCRDEFKIVKLGDTHNLISSDIKIDAPLAVIDNSKTIFDIDLFPTRIKSDHNNHSPPGSSGISLNILYCVFRI